MRFDVLATAYDGTLARLALNQLIEEKSKQKIHSWQPRASLNTPSIMSIPECEPARWVIAVAVSAGGWKALSVLLGGLPKDFPAAIAIVMHLSSAAKSILAESLPETAIKTGDVDFILPLNHIARKLVTLVGPATLSK